MDNNLADVFAKYRVIPVVVIEDADFALGLADAPLEGGLPVAEITFRTKTAAQTISILNDKRPELTLGAGTVLTIDNVKVAKDCSAKVLTIFIECFTKPVSVVFFAIGLYLCKLSLVFEDKTAIPVIEGISSTIGKTWSSRYRYMKRCRPTVGYAKGFCRF